MIEFGGVWKAVLCGEHWKHKAKNFGDLSNISSQNIKNSSTWNCRFGRCAVSEQMGQLDQQFTELCRTSAFFNHCSFENNSKCQSQIYLLKSKWPSLWIDHHHVRHCPWFFVGFDSYYASKGSTKSEQCWRRYNYGDSDENI